MFTININSDLTADVLYMDFIIKPVHINLIVQLKGYFINLHFNYKSFIAKVIILLIMCAKQVKLIKFTNMIK